MYLIEAAAGLCVEAVHVESVGVEAVGVVPLGIEAIGIKSVGVKAAGVQGISSGCSLRPALCLCVRVAFRPILGSRVK